MLGDYLIFGDFYAVGFIDEAEQRNHRQGIQNAEFQQRRFVGQVVSLPLQ